MMGELRLINSLFFHKDLFRIKNYGINMFGKDNNQSNERIIYQTKSNFIFGCKGAIFGLILLFILLYVTRLIIQFIGKIQVYLISRIQLPLTRYATIAMFVLMLIVMIYIIWKIISWYSKEYILTESKIIVKSGVLISNKNYLPFSKIQDVNISQSIFGRLFNIGSISAYSAYDNNNIQMENIGNPSEVEEIIFARMSNQHNQLQKNQYYDDVIIPEHPRNNFNGQNYTYYQNESYPQNETYEQYNEPVSHQEESYESYQPINEEYKNNEPDNNTNHEESGETVVKRHFNKFKR